MDLKWQIVFWSIPDTLSSPVTACAVCFQCSNKKSVCPGLCSAGPSAHRAGQPFASAASRPAIHVAACAARAKTPFNTSKVSRTPLNTLKKYLKHPQIHYTVYKKHTKHLCAPRRAALRVGGEHGGGRGHEGQPRGPGEEAGHPRRRVRRQGPGAARPRLGRDLRAGLESVERVSKRVSRRCWMCPEVS